MKLIKLFILLSMTISLANANPIAEKLEKSLKSTKTSNLEEEAKRLGALGSLNHQKGDYETALMYYDKSLSIREKLGDVENLSYANMLFLSAIASHKLGNSCKAMEKMNSVIMVYKVLAPEEKTALAQKEVDNVYKPACGTSTSFLMTEK